MTGCPHRNYIKRYKTWKLFSPGYHTTEAKNKHATQTHSKHFGKSMWTREWRGIKWLWRVPNDHERFNPSTNSCVLQSGLTVGTHWQPCSWSKRATNWWDRSRALFPGISGVWWHCWCYLLLSAKLPVCVRQRQLDSHTYLDIKLNYY